MAARGAGTTTVSACTPRAAGPGLPGLPFRRRFGRWVAHVVVATGHTHTPVAPEWPGLAGFTGDATLARDFRNGRRYADRDVLVAGTGSTGTEIATDVAENGATHVSRAARRARAREPEGAAGLGATGFTNPISGMLRELRIDGERIAARVADALSREVARYGT